MNLKLKRIVTSIGLLLILVTPILAYELPQINLSDNNKTEIIFFTSKSIVKNDQAFYEVSWETVNATDVMITFFGKVKPTGKVVVTKDEYNRGPITLTASNKDGSSVANKTINSQKNSADPIVIFKENENDERYYNNTMPYRNYGRRLPRRMY